MNDELLATFTMDNTTGMTLNLAGRVQVEDPEGESTIDYQVRVVFDPDRLGVWRNSFKRFLDGFRTQRITPEDLAVVIQDVFLDRVAPKNLLVDIEVEDQGIDHEVELFWEADEEDVQSGDLDDGGDDDLEEDDFPDDMVERSRPAERLERLNRVESEGVPFSPDAKVTVFHSSGL